MLKSCPLHATTIRNQAKVNELHDRHSSVRKTPAGRTIICCILAFCLLPGLSSCSSVNSAVEMDSIAQAVTIQRVFDLGVGIEQYILDYPEIGAPKAGTAFELSLLLRETGICTEPPRSVDGWGNQILFTAGDAPGDTSYRIISLGSDKSSGPVPGISGKTETFKHDIVWHNGIFVQCPKGTLGRMSDRATLER